MMNISNNSFKSCLNNASVSLTMLGDQSSRTGVLQENAASTQGSGRKTSRVWKYFRLVDNSHYMCCLCQFIGAYSNTTNMRKHIQNHHPEIYQDLLDHTRPSNRMQFCRPFQSSSTFRGVELFSNYSSYSPDLDFQSFIQPIVHSNHEHSVGVGSNRKPEVISNYNRIQNCNTDTSLFEELVDGIEGGSLASDVSGFGASNQNEKENKDNNEDNKSDLSYLFTSNSSHKQNYKSDDSWPNLGDERKSESSQNANSSSQNLLGENSLGSTEGQEGSDDAATGALSPEQFMSEEMDQGTSSSTNDVPQRPESYKLRHNNHFNLVLESLAGDESFMDITLTAQGKAIKAHKSVLSAVSPYFRSVLKENPCQHPIIIMPRDIRFEELNNIISYIYKGEMTVATEDLPSLLKTAEVLQVTGLAPSESGNSTSGFISQMQSLSSSIFPNNTNTSYTWTSKSGTAKKTSKRNHSQSHQEQQQQQWFAENLLQPPSVDSQGRLDPQDFLTADMTCVKEEIPSDTEADEESTEQDQSQRDESTMETPPLLLDSDNRLANDPTDPLSETATDTLDNNNSHASNLPFKPGETESVCNSNDGQSDNSTTPEPNVCPHCTETHRPLSTLQSHLRLKHPSKPSFVCQCSRVFVRQSRLNDHSKNCAI